MSSNRANKGVSFEDETTTSSEPTQKITISHLTAFVNVLSRGFIDAISIHRVLPLLVNNTASLLVVLKIMGANIALILGSEFLFHKGITPLLDRFSTEVLELKDHSQYQSITYLIFQMLWLVPICVLCYICCLTWYQELADSVHKYQQEQENLERLKQLEKVGTEAKGKLEKDNAPTSNPDALSSVQNSIYALLVWVFAFVQVQILTALIPGLINLAIYLVSALFNPNHGSTDSTAGIGISTVFSIHNAFYTIFFTILSLLKQGSTTIGLLFMAVLYGWYSFDPKWISEGKSPMERFSCIETYFFYFLGFGAPFVLLNRLTSFFIGFGGFLTVFPFCIILGSVITDYPDIYDKYGISAKSTTVGKVKVFKLAQIWTLHGLKWFGHDIAKKIQRREAKLKSKHD